MRPQVAFTLDQELFELVRDYHNAAIAQHGERYPVDTFRELLWAGITGRGDIAAARALQEGMKREAKTWLVGRMYSLVREMEGEIDRIMNAQVAEMAALVPEVPNGDQE